MLLVRSHSLHAAARHGGGSAHEANPWGDLCFLVASVCAASLLVIKKGLVVEGSIKPFTIMAAMDTCAAMLGAASAAPFVRQQLVERSLPLEALAAAGVVALVTSLDALLVMYAFTHLPATVVAVSNTWVPVFTCIIQFVALNEVALLGDLIYGPFIAFGVAIVVWEQHRTTKEALAVREGARRGGSEEEANLRQPLLAPPELEP